MLRDRIEVLVRAQKRKVMTKAELRDQRIDRADLDARPPTRVAQLRRCDMVFSRRLNERQGCKSLDDPGARAGAADEA